MGEFKFKPIEMPNINVDKTISDFNRVIGKFNMETQGIMRDFEHAREANRIVSIRNAENAKASQDERVRLAMSAQAKVRSNIEKKIAEHNRKTGDKININWQEDYNSPDRDGVVVVYTTYTDEHGFHNHVTSWYDKDRGIIGEEKHITEHRSDLMTGQTHYVGELVKQVPKDSLRGDEDKKIITDKKGNLEGWGKWGIPLKEAISNLRFRKGR